MVFWRKSQPGSQNEAASPGADDGAPVRMGSGRQQEALTGILKRFLITEKSSRGAVQNTYLFAVADDTNKIEIKRAVEARFGVKVERVHISRMPGKVRRRGHIIGWKSGFKKAGVTLAAGEKIELT